MKSLRKPPSGGRLFATSLMLLNLVSSASVARAATPVAPVKAPISQITISGKSSPNSPQSPLSHVMVSVGSIRILDLSNSAVMRISGNLTNHGTLYVVSTNPRVTNATIIAQNIINLPGGTITTVLPNGGLTGFANALPNLGLRLAAITSILNSGSINSAANLSLIAGKSIVNSGMASSGVSSALSVASVQAANNLSILAPSISNQGLFVSQTGNINVVDPALYASTVNELGLQMANRLPNIINIANSGGSMQALNGSVNIGGPTFGAQTIISILGGNVSAQQINLDAGGGAFRGDLDSSSGTFNVSGATAQVGTGTSNLNLGNIHVTGDPTFFNSQGNITISSDLSVPENLVILAAGNITASSLVNISTQDANGIGHDITMVAGATLLPIGIPPVLTPNGANTLTNPLLPGQFVSVVGGNLFGGSIALANSILDTRSSAAGANGGNVTLVAFRGLFSTVGGVGNVSILTGGSGLGKNGSVNIIAGGNLNGTTVNGTGRAVDQVTVNSTGAFGLLPSAVNITAAQPTANAKFDNQGKMTGTGFAPLGTPTNFDINISLPTGATTGNAIETDSGSVSILTNGLVTVAAPIVTSGAIAGRNGGSVSITGGSIDVEAPILAVGAKGAVGATGATGLGGAAGGGGGSGGRITLDGTSGIMVNNIIQADAGSGGRGGNGGQAVPGHTLAPSGGAGGGGGMAGTISLETTDSAITQGAFLMSANGGDGGQGGDGINGAPALLGGTVAQSAGSGGSAGLATSGGMISTKSGLGNVTLNGSIFALGGSGAAGGAGGQGGLAPGAGGSGGTGGSSGSSSSGGDGGSLSISTSSGAIKLPAGIFLSGGLGASSAAGGNGTNGGTSSSSRGGNGGAVGVAGDGGNGGSITVISTSGTADLTGSISINGGAGANQFVSAGNGGNGTAAGGAGGSLGGAGKGGDGGNLFLTTSGALTISAPINADGGAGGIFSGTAGSGGNGGAGGAGGSTGTAGDGGDGRLLSFTSGAVTVSSSISSSGGIGGDMSGASGAGGTGLNASGGAGGAVKGSGGGGGGGMITFSSSGTYTATQGVFAIGGQGGTISSTAGAGGAGGKAAGSSGGVGGSIFDAGSGGGGGSITIKTKGDITPVVMDSSGGAGGGQSSSQGGAGGAGAVGGNGGSVGASGAGGIGGGITLTSKPLLPTTTGTILISTPINANGGIAGQYTGIGGAGANGTAGKGGNGGSAGAQGDGGLGGAYSITGTVLTLLNTGSMYANGGATPGYAGVGGNGGNAGTTGNGGSGGSTGASGSGGSARNGFGRLIAFDINISGAVTVNENPGPPLVDIDSIGASGGTVGPNSAHSGSGGNGSILRTFGGLGGGIGINGNGGNGGTISIKGGTGDITGMGVIVAAGGAVTGVTEVSGNGGNGGTAGNGGASGSIMGNGTGGTGGTINLSTTSGNITVTPLIAPGGDNSFGATWAPKTGSGGNGGLNGGSGGNSGSIASNGDGGDGGVIKLQSITGNLGITGNVAAPYVVAGGAVGFLINPAGVGSFPPGTPIILTPSTGNGGNVLCTTCVGPTMQFVGGNSGSIGNAGKGGSANAAPQAGALTMTTGGNISIPKGSVVATGGDGGLMQAVTGSGGTTPNGIGGNSGNIGVGGLVVGDPHNGGGGTGGLVQITSLLGTVTVNGVLNAQGGSVNGTLNATGPGGNATVGTGGNSGTIAALGGGGNAGTVNVTAFGNIVGSEAVLTIGGSAARYFNAQSTGNGGNGSVKGGNSGDIGSSGKAGDGGGIKFTSLFGDVTPDHLYADGGVPALLVFDPNTKFATFNTALPMTALTGQGGTASVGVGKLSTGVGGTAGSVGSSASGGGGGKIEVSGPTISASVFYRANGGFGAPLISGGGAGGVGGKTGGDGGSVGAGGDGGVGGSITLTATGLIPGTPAPDVLDVKEITAFGGAGGSNASLGGAGGNTTFGNGKAGNGGSVDKGGDGGLGGTASVTMKNLLSDPLASISIEGNIGWQFYGGAGGDQISTGGAGGSNLLLLGTVKPLTGNAGNGGNTFGSGKGGGGGSVTIKISGGAGVSYPALAMPPIVNPGIIANGGASGIMSTHGGLGGNGTGAGVGGDGGSVGIQGNGGLGGSISISADVITLRSGSALQVNGGAAGLVLGSTAANGGNGAKGGDGGILRSAGQGGNGGLISLTAKQVIDINGELDSNGGNRPFIDQLAGNGGDCTAGGNAGGAGGSIGIPGSAGDGGTIVISAAIDPAQGMISSTTNAPLITANGGNSNGATLVAGNGGSVVAGGAAGGVGGAVGGGPGGGKGGKIVMSSTSDITTGTLQADGGSTNGTYTATSGNGGNGSVTQGTAGLGGEVFSNGDAGNGGSIILKSTMGDINIVQLEATGGNVGIMIGVGGKGGVSPTQAGGDGGKVDDNGTAGNGGTVTLTAAGTISTNAMLSVAPWTLAGGSVGSYTATGGNGGTGNPSTAQKTAKFSGGTGGRAGSNGGAGTGGVFAFTSSAADITLSVPLIVDGGSVTGAYTATGGNGAAGGTGGGDGGDTGTPGAAGAGGGVIINAGTTATVPSISANAGTINNLQITASGGNSGAGGFSGGTGGSIGKGAPGAAGGLVFIQALGAISISTGDVSANASAGSDNRGTPGASAPGITHGGIGGSIGDAGAGGAGGFIDIETSLTVNVAGSVSANAGNGGSQFGIAKDGSNATATTGLEGLGGKGGDVGAAGAPGFVASPISPPVPPPPAPFAPTSITLKGDTGVTVGGNVTANGGAGGSNSGKAGKGGDGLIVGGPGGNGGVATGGAGKLIPSGADGGSITISAQGGLVTVSGSSIQANGSNGGANTGIGGNGGNGTVTGGAGGSVGFLGSKAGGNGGNGGSVTILSGQTAVIPVPTATAGTGGPMTGTAGAGGTGATMGRPGFIGLPGANGQPGNVSVSLLNLDSWPNDEASDDPFKKRKVMPTYVALNSELTKYGDYIVVPDENSREKLQGIAFVEFVAPMAVTPIKNSTVGTAGLANLISESTFTTALSERLANSGTQIVAGQSGVNFELKRGTVLFAPSGNDIKVHTTHGNIEIAAGSKVLVETDSEATTLRTLHDSKHGDVQFVCGPTVMPVSIGRQLVVRSGDIDYRAANSSARIAVRNTTQQALPNGMTASMSEFSLLSALANQQTLKSLCHSSRKDERKQYLQILKNACVLTSMSTQRGQYREQ